MEEFNSTTKKADRHRKRAFYNAIRQQIEFYLGDVNLSKDRFFSNLLQQSPYIDIDIILKCNKLKKFTTEPKHIVKALKKSNLLSVTEDETKIYRKVPISQIENTDDCTIYVEDLPLEADHDWLKEVFKTNGEVVYVSVPHYKLSKKIKGFAFVQFNSPESAEKTLKAFRSANSCLSSNMAPSELRSIQTFEGEKEIVIREHGDKNLEDIRCITSQLKSDSSEIDDEPKKKKRKIKIKKEIEIKKETISNEDNNTNDDDTQTNNKKDADKVKQESINSKKLKTSTSDAENIYEEEKHTRKRKRKKHKKPEKVETYGMQILSKQEWKKLRNKYLEEQRKRMHELKQQLKKTSLNSCEKYKQQENIKTEEEPQTKSNVSECRVKFAPGVIIKLHLDQPIKDIKHFKNDIKRYADVEYIDAQEDDVEAYLRCSSNEVANQVMSLNKWPNMAILYGAEEIAYWEKIKQDRIEKFDKKIRCNTRGKNKLIKKVETALATHIKFLD